MLRTANAGAERQCMSREQLVSDRDDAHDVHTLL
ncbi:MAG: hypothetical protein QOI47_61, partial [Actinomycetota bacterium]|nr:hypothetical protein [Actinomycetota bacterium]